MKKGFTLVELLIVMAILAILSVAMTAALNPKALVDKGYDARRKKDLIRIRVAFEEYFNDNGCYPNSGVINNLVNKSNCNSNIFAPWLDPWVCDPQGTTYFISTQIDLCPHWFKVFTQLQNRQDGEIPADWYTGGAFTVGSLGEFSRDDVNFGISSSNVKWDERWY